MCSVVKISILKETKGTRFNTSYQCLMITNYVFLKSFSLTYSVQNFFFHKALKIVVESRTPNREVLGSIPTGGTVLCP